MRNLILVLPLALLPLSFAAAEQPVLPNPHISAKSGKLLPVKKSAGAVNSCAAYGAGFVRIEGTDTCAKIGGAVTFDGRSGR